MFKENTDTMQALVENHTLSETITNLKGLPSGTKLYLSKKPLNEPWWKEYWGIEEKLNQAQQGALVLMPVERRLFAITFGSTYHQINDDHIEYDFGLITTLNSLDPKHIKSTDILQPERTMRSRIQLPVANELNYFDFNSDETILKSLTGAVLPAYKNIFSSISGGNNIKVSSKNEAQDLPNLCSKLLAIYNKEDFKENFPGIQNIKPIKEPSLIKELNEKLVFDFNAKSYSVVLSIPEIFNYNKDYIVKYSGFGPSQHEFSDVFIHDFREEYLVYTETTITNVSDLKKGRLIISNDIDSKPFSIYKCISYDTIFEDKNYHLSDGQWFQVEDDYLKKICATLDLYFTESHIVLKDCTTVKEGDYNKKMAENNTDIFCLDLKDISPSKQTQVEPCDLLHISDDYLDLIHVKISTRSSSLSHLFNQGIVSSELLRVNEEARTNLFELCNNDNRVSELLEADKFRVTYGIITKKKDKKSDGLPLFSKVSLYRAVNRFKSMNIPVSIVYIYDDVDRKVVKSKNKKTKAKK